MVGLTILSVVLLALLIFSLYEWGQALNRTDEALALIKGEVCEDDDCNCGDNASK